MAATSETDSSPAVPAADAEQPPEHPRGYAALTGVPQPTGALLPVETLPRCDRGCERWKTFVKTVEA